MVKYLNTINGSCLIKFNKETEEVKSLESMSTNIDWMWIADEDGELDGKEIKTGDIVFRMYGIGKDRCKREFFIIKNEGLKDYYKRVIEYHKQQAEKNSCCDCECATCCE